MTTTATIRSGDTVLPGSATQVPCFFDMCSVAGAVGNFYGPFTPGSVVTDQLGGGPLADQVLAFLAIPGAVACYAVPVTPTWASYGAVTHVGAGPTVTWTAAPGASGPFDAHTPLVTILTSGPNGQAMASIAYDGSAAPSETFVVPSATSGYIAGTGAITPTVLGEANGLTLVFVLPSVQTLTFPAGSLVAAAAGLHAATATVAAPVTLLAAALIAGGVAALLANPRKLTFATAGGTAADAPANVAITGTDYAGATVTETLNLAQTATSVTSVNVYATIVSLVYPAADSTGATIAVGYADTYATPAELVAEAQTLATAATLAVTATDVQTSGGHFLAFATTSTGTSATVTLNASPGTFATILGFTTAQTNTGALGAYAPAWTGGVLTFPTGTYPKGDTYAVAPAPPSASTAAVIAGLTVARANWQAFPFGAAYVTALPSSAANAAALQAACSSTVGAWRTDNTLPVPVFTGTAFHTASAVAATNQANITTMDAATAAAFVGNAAALDLVCVDDCYVPGSTQLRPGTFRRSAAWAAAVQRAVLPKLGASIAEGVVPSCSLRAPDLLTLARNEATATIKLGPSTGGNTGPGFCVLKTTPQGVSAPKFSAGVTRAGATSRLRIDNAVFIGLQLQVIAFAIASRWEGQTWPTSPDKTASGPAGQATDAIVRSKADDVYTAIEPYVLPVGKDPSVSAPPQVVIDNSGVFANTGLVPLSIYYIPVAPVFDVTIGLVAISVSITAGNGAGTAALGG